MTARQLRVDAGIAEAAARLGVPYVSMLQERWIPWEHSGAVLDPDNHHPTRRGQQYLGLRLASALHLLLPDVVAPLT